jgi:hypothetical protein
VGSTKAPTRRLGGVTCRRSRFAPSRPRPITRQPSRANELMDAEEDTREADELDVLATLIEAYEDKHYPMDPPDPMLVVAKRR